MANYEKSPMGNRTYYSQITKQAATPRGLRNTYNKALQDHYIRLLEKLGMLSTLRKCIREGMKDLKGTFDIDVAYNLLRQSEKQKREIKSILGFLNKEYLDENEVLCRLTQYVKDLEAAMATIDNNFTDRDKFSVGNNKNVHKDEVLKKAEEVLVQVKKYIRFFDYISQFVLSEEKGMTV